VDWCRLRQSDGTGIAELTVAIGFEMHPDALVARLDRRIELVIQQPLQAVMPLDSISKPAPKCISDGLAL